MRGVTVLWYVRIRNKRTTKRLTTVARGRGRPSGADKGGEGVQGAGVRASISFGGIPFFVVSPSVARAIVCPPNLNLCRLPVMARFSTFENLLCLVELLLRRHRSLLQSTTAKWTHWDLNPGPSACEADVIPLHHVPHVPSHSKGVCHVAGMKSQRETKQN